MALLDIQAKVSGKYIEGEVVKLNKKTVWIKLPDGSIIKRKLSRDLK